MKIIGWIRVGDKAACGGTVIEGLSTNKIHGIESSYEGAKMDCRKNCHIGEAHPTNKLANGRNRPHHGHRTMPGMCPLISTVNDICGRGNDTNAEIPIHFIQNEDGEWIGKSNEGYDQHFHLIDEVTGKPLAKRFYRMTCNGRVIEGHTDNNGYTSKVETDVPASVKIEVFPEGYAGTST
ncbi:putative Zn-binding protein involved in type VI secretion [Oxalobacteraceae bacterium GrIS 1.11]